MNENLDIFWVVWNPARQMPLVRHDELWSATSEAKRLAEKQPGEKFYVLKAGLVVSAKPAEPHVELLE